MGNVARIDDRVRNHNQAHRFTPVALTPDQTKKWTETRTALLWQAPAFSHILYSMMNRSGGEVLALFTKDVPIAATDGVNLILNPDEFFKFNLQERVFVCAHEILHCILDHCGLIHAFNARGKVGYASGKSLPWKPELMNVATDLVINDLLVEGKVGKIPKDVLHDTKVATGKDSAVDAYAKIFKDGNGIGGAKGNSFDQHLAPGAGSGQDPTTASQDRNPVEWKTAIAAAAASARARGLLPAGLERVFGEILEPSVSWSEKIEALFARKIGSGGYDWRRPDRRLITRDDPVFAPGRSGHGAGTVVVAVDTSGSIGPKILDGFFAEMSGILEDVRPKRLIVLWCDAKVHRHDELEDAGDLNVVRSKRAPGGGGTAFEPVFEWIDQEGLTPDALVYLTDGYGSFPKGAPTYPTIWGSISKGVKYPFGDVVDVEIAA